MNIRAAIPAAPTGIEKKSTAGVTSGRRQSDIKTIRQSRTENAYTENATTTDSHGLWEWFIRGPMASPTTTQHAPRITQNRKYLLRKAASVIAGTEPLRVGMP